MTFLTFIYLLNTWMSFTIAHFITQLLLMGILVKQTIPWLCYSAQLRTMVFTNCTFVDNFGTAISAIQSNVIFEGNVTFRNNTGINGGALFFCEDSTMYLRTNTSIYFFDNHALNSGGAIYAQDQCLTNPQKCFFRLEDLQTIHLHFENNTANYAGNALYGGIVDESLCRFDIISDISNTNFKRSEVSSDPTGVIFCNDSDDALKLETKEIGKCIYPVEDFYLTATTVGQFSGTVPGDIQVIVSNPSSTTKILSSQESQPAQNSSECATLTYTIFSDREFEQLRLVAVRPQLTVDTKSTHPVINVTLKSCPQEFKLIEGTEGFQCDCSPYLTQVDHDIKCNINSQTIHRPPGVWIGYHNTTDHNSINESGEVLVHTNCPLHYCVSTPNDINLAINPDTAVCFQLLWNSLWSMPGGTQPYAWNTSLQALPQRLLYLLLLLAFSVAGIALLAGFVVCLQPNGDRRNHWWVDILCQHHLG